MSHDLSPAVDDLVKQLSSPDMVLRIRAREALVDVGAAAVPSICQLSETDNDHVRWECAKALAKIADPVSIDTLVGMLEDSEEGIRWDAAIGLINIGRRAVAPLLRAIIHRSKDYTILVGSRHVIHQFSKAPWGESLQPVYEALNSFCARESAPVEAARALETWG